MKKTDLTDVAFQGRIVAPTNVADDVEWHLHDPLTQFACVFSAIIHDVVRFGSQPMIIHCSPPRRITLEYRMDSSQRRIENWPPGSTGRAWLNNDPSNWPGPSF
jgi:hypothetical protein